MKNGDIPTTAQAFLRQQTEPFFTIFHDLRRKSSKNEMQLRERHNRKSKWHEKKMFLGMEVR